MDHSLLQHLRTLRPGSGIVLVLAFLLLPYLVDVVYYGDFTPTHYAQENTIDEEDARTIIDKPSHLVAVDEAISGIRVRLLAPDVNAQASLQAGVLLLSYYPISESLTSRPPPPLLPGWVRPLRDLDVVSLDTPSVP